MTPVPLLSRVANSVYWASRYIERAENVARYIDVNLQLMLDGAGTDEQWKPLVDTSGDAAAFRDRYGKASREKVIRFLTVDPENPNSILSCLRAARENSRTVRDTISSEMWEQANKLHLMIQEELTRNRAETAPFELFYDLRMGCHLFEGITDGTMSHNEAYRFARLGRLIERADKTTRILDVKYFLLLPRLEDVGSSKDDVQWAAVLKSVSGFEMYRKRFGRIKPSRIAEFLLLDRDFPRSVRFCLSRADRALHAITGSPEGSGNTPAERRLGQLRAEFDYASVDEIIANGLHEFLDSIQSKLNDIDDAVFDTFFASRPLD